MPIWLPGVDSLNANHSFKYFGKEQGISVYTR
jgi:hypothetical protein